MGQLYKNIIFLFVLISLEYIIFARILIQNDKTREEHVKAEINSTSIYSEISKGNEVTGNFYYHRILPSIPSEERENVIASSMLLDNYSMFTTYH